MRTRRYPAEALGACAAEDWVDTSRRPFVEGGTAWIPVRDGYPWDEDLPERSNPATRGYQRLGDLVLFHGPEPDEAAVRDAIARCSPRGVLWVRGHAGVERVPEVAVLWGEAGEVVHRENGLVYLLDPSKVMFSQGNREEKARLAGLVRPGERTADLFAGIGYFTLSAARAGARVHAMEINPVAFGYLEENLARTGSRTGSRPSAATAATSSTACTTGSCSGTSRPASFLADALAHVRTGSVLHVHAVERTAGESAPALVETAAESGLEVASSCRPVKSYGPGRVHTVHDLVIL